jgi:hypothetical protein
MAGLALVVVTTLPGTAAADASTSGCSAQELLKGRPFPPTDLSLLSTQSQPGGTGEAGGLVGETSVDLRIVLAKRSSAGKAPTRTYGPLQLVCPLIGEHPDDVVNVAMDGRPANERTEETS